MTEERREDDRNLCADLVQVSWKSEEGDNRKEWATLEDISSGGACLKLEDRLPENTIVSLQFSTSSCKARVKYCVAEQTGYLLGVEFENGYHWSRREFKPMHLVQFRLRPARKDK